jgi:hypothetical protein
MKKGTVLIMLLGLSAICNAQKYYTGIGLRFGKFNTGLTFKHFYAPENRYGIEIDGFYTNIPQGGYTLKGLYLVQNRIKVPILQLPLDFIFGGGIHLAYFPYHKDINDPGYYKNVDGVKKPYYKSVVVAGVDGSVQLEYKIPMRKVPFTINIDVNPFYEFLNPGPEWLDFGASVRYVFR